MRLLGISAWAALVLLTAACQGGETAPPPKSESVSVVATAIATQAERVAEIAGVPPAPGSGSTPMNVMACTGKAGETAADVFYILAGYHLKVGADRLTPVVEDVHGYWTSLGWQVQAVEHLSADAMRAKATDPATEFGYEISSTGEPSTLLLWINSPCRTDPDGPPKLGPYTPPSP